MATANTTTTTSTIYIHWLGLNASNQQLLQNTINLNNTLISSSIFSSTGQRPNPEYIRLSVYGLTEPDEEMKQDLCKTLQSELDYWLLIKMCNSIDKNTYKTSSAQHPDKITEEDLSFFKQICENYFDFEIPLPFIFNFNRTMRENFFFFIKQVFNANFKAIDTMPAYANTSNTTVNKSNLLANRSKSQIDQASKHAENEYDELASLIYNDENQKSQPPSGLGEFANSSSEFQVKSTTQSVSSQFTHLNSFSFMSMQPQLGPFDETKPSSAPG